MRLLRGVRVWKFVLLNFNKVVNFASWSFFRPFIRYRMNIRNTNTFKNFILDVGSFSTKLIILQREKETKSLISVEHKSVTEKK